MDSPTALPGCRGTSPGLPGPVRSLSTRALPTHPGQLAADIGSWHPQTMAGFVISGRVAAAGRCVTRPNRVRCRWARVFALPPWRSGRPTRTRGRTNPFRAVSCPSTPDRSYMLNEQFTWLTPRSQQENCGLSRRNQSPQSERPWACAGARKPAEIRDCPAPVSQVSRASNGPPFRLFVLCALCVTRGTPAATSSLCTPLDDYCRGFITYALMVLSWPPGPTAATPKTWSSMFLSGSTNSVTFPT